MGSLILWLRNDAPALLGDLLLGAVAIGFLIVAAPMMAYTIFIVVGGALASGFTLGLCIILGHVFKDWFSKITL